MKTVDDYIASFEGETFERLKTLDAYIKSLNTEIITKISWSMPSYMLDDNYIVQFCAFKNHIGLYPSPAAIEMFRQSFEKENLKYSKGGVQLPNCKPLPLELIKQIAIFNCASRNKNQIRRESAKRDEKPIPDYLKERLIKEGQIENYKARPRYQRTGYISWIEKAAKAETKEKRIVQMTEELRNRDAYMGMGYNAKISE